MQKPSKWKASSRRVSRPSMARRTLCGLLKSMPTAALSARPGPHLLLISLQFSVSAQPDRMRSLTMR